jgi:probable rRNA maturation factor
LLRQEGWPEGPAELDVWFCGEEEMQELNRRFRRRRGATDVLSFPQYAPGERPGPGLPVALGDVVVCVDVARRQAEARGVSFSREVVWLFLHSLLHLVGYDDDTDEGLREMVERANIVLSASH